MPNPVLIFGLGKVYFSNPACQAQVAHQHPTLGNFRLCYQNPHLKLLSTVFIEVFSFQRSFAIFNNHFEVYKAKTWAISHTSNCDTH